jgi:hypothetical protein
LVAVVVSVPDTVVSIVSALHNAGLNPPTFRLNPPFESQAPEAASWYTPFTLEADGADGTGALAGGLADTPPGGFGYGSWLCARASATTIAASASVPTCKHTRILAPTVRIDSVIT